MNETRLQQNEELKREKCWDPQQQWQVLQKTIAWVDSQQDVPRNSPAGCLAAQRRKLGTLAMFKKPTRLVDEH